MNENELFEKYIKEFRGIITNLCEYLNISTNSLANRSLLTQSTLNNIVNGKSKNPKLSSLISIANGLDIELNDLLYYVDKSVGITTRRKRRLRNDNFEMNEKREKVDELLELSLLNFIQCELLNSKVPIYLIGNKKEISPTIEKLKDVHQKITYNNLLLLRENNGFIEKFFYENPNINIEYIKNFMKTDLINNCKLFTLYDQIQFPASFLFLNIDYLSFLIILDYLIKKDERKNVNLIDINNIFVESNIRKKIIGEYL